MAPFFPQVEDTQMSESPEKKRRTAGRPPYTPRTLFVVDIETTGPNTYSDEMFAIGWAIVRTLRDGTLDVKDKGRIVMDEVKELKDAKEMTALWVEHGWNMETLHFWQENLWVYNAIAKASGPGTVRAKTKMEMASALFAARWSDSTITNVCYDTIGFDPKWTDNLLQEYSFVPLFYNRSFYPFRQIFTSSYCEGVICSLAHAYDVDDGLLWSAYTPICDSLIESNVKGFTAHDPVQDCIKIACKLVAAEALIEFAAGMWGNS